MVRWVKDLSNRSPSWVSRARGHWRLLGSSVEFTCLLRKRSQGVYTPFPISCWQRASSEERRVPSHSQSESSGNEIQKPASQHLGERLAGTRTGSRGVCRVGQGLSLAERENSGT